MCVYQRLIERGRKRTMTDRQMDKKTDRQKDRQRQKDRVTKGQTERQTDRQANRQTERERETDRQTEKERQTDRERDRQSMVNRVERTRVQGTTRLRCREVAKLFQKENEVHNHKTENAGTDRI